MIVRLSRITGSLVVRLAVAVGTTMPCRLFRLSWLFRLGWLCARSLIRRRAVSPFTSALILDITAGWTFISGFGWILTVL